MWTKNKKNNVKYFSNLSCSEMLTTFQSCFLVANLIKTYSSKVLYLLQSSSMPYTAEGYFEYTTAYTYFVFPFKVLGLQGPSRSPAGLF